MVTMKKRMVLLQLFLLILFLLFGCTQPKEETARVDSYRSSIAVWDTLTQEEQVALLKAHSLQYQAYMERLPQLSELIFTQLTASDLNGDLQQRSVADDFARAFLRSAWTLNLPDSPVLSVRIVEHPDQTLATEGERAKYDRLAVELIDEIGDCYVVCFADWTGMLYQDGVLIESHYSNLEF